MILRDKIRFYEGEWWPHSRDLPACGLPAGTMGQWPGPSARQGHGLLGSAWSPGLWAGGVVLWSEGLGDRVASGSGPQGERPSLTHAARRTWPPGKALPLLTALGDLLPGRACPGSWEELRGDLAAGGELPQTEAEGTGTGPGAVD